MKKEDELKNYYYNKSSDLTRFYLDSVLDGTAPSLGNLHRYLKDIQFDRVIQSFSENFITQARQGKNADYFQGMYDMSQATKTFLVNLYNISKEADHTEHDLSMDERRELLAKGISENDFNLILGDDTENE